LGNVAAGKLPETGRNVSKYFFGGTPYLLLGIKEKMGRFYDQEINQQSKPD
jgi:hypothetical protein